MATFGETQKWELFDADGQPQQQIETIIVEEEVEVSILLFMLDSSL
jgi:hypothetical protein